MYEILLFYKGLEQSTNYFLFFLGCEGYAFATALAEGKLIKKGSQCLQEQYINDNGK